MNKKKIIMSSLLAVSFTGLMFTTAFTLTSCVHDKGFKASTNPADFVKHGYNSISNQQQNVYYPNVKRESISFAIPEATDHTIADRDRYVYYPESTNIYIANLNDGKYKDKSINVTGDNAILDGFAYIAEDDLDSQANTFIDVFAGDIHLASYFSCGKDPFTTKCTKGSLIDFLKTTTTDHALHLSGLLKDDNQRDNAVLSLLNPKIWDIWLSTTYSDHSLKIDYIDLSNNYLMCYPNIASIPSLYDNTKWMFNDGDHYVWKDSDDADYKMNNFNNKVNPASPLPTDDKGTYSGYFKGIDLSHNELVYFNEWANMSVSDSKNNVNDYYDYCPSLLTIVAPIYEKDSMINLFCIQMWISKPSQRDGYYGVNLDYNHLTYEVYGSMKSGDGANSYLERQLTSWFCFDEEDIEKIPGFKNLSISSYIKLRYAYSRCFMTYTVDNANNSAISEFEHILGWGVYQTDAFIVNPKCVKNWYKDFNSTQYANFSKIYASKVTAHQYETLQFNLFVLNSTFPFVSIPPQTGFVSDIISVAFLHKSPYYPIYNDLNGTFYVSILGSYIRSKYIPSTIDITSSIDVNQMISNLVSEVMSILSLHANWAVQFNVFKTNTTSWVAISFMFMMFALVIISMVSIKLVENIKKVRIRRGNYFNEED